MFMTPRGLKIRIDIPSGFTLLSRLWENDPKTDAFRVLKTSEGLESIPAFAGFIGAFIGVFYGSASWHVAAGLVTGNVLGTLLTMFGAFVIPGLPTIVTWWSWISGYGLLTGVGLASAWVLKGWGFAAAWIAGLFIAFVISNVFIQWPRMMYYKKKVGVPFTQSEINFFNAYRLHADRLGISHSIEVSEDEIQSGGWQRCLEDFASKYPEAVAKFDR
jgi:hypothetical protein